MFDRIKMELKKIKASIIYKKLYEDYQEFYNICSKKADFDGEINGFYRYKDEKIDEDVLFFLNDKVQEIGAEVSACLIQNPDTLDINILYHMEKQLEGYKVVDLDKYQMNKEIDETIKAAEDRVKKYNIR